MKLTSRIVTIDRTPVFMGPDSLASVDKIIRSGRMGRDGVFILVDKNTKKHCLPLVIQNSVALAGAGILEVDGGEDSKTLATAERLWNELLRSEAGRESLLVNLGGGVISDLGGFVASGYKRGISYINIPTSLMGQVDASIGGKTSVNIGGIKNQVGSFYAARAVFIFPGFMLTLPPEHLRSGMAEIIKCALVGNARLWGRLRSYSLNEILSLPAEHAFWQEMVSSAVTYKNKVIVNDFRERKLRKVLNFGHTIGHALEASSFTGSRRPILHGEAVAAGMVCSAYLSHLKTGLAEDEMEAVKAFIHGGYPRYRIGQPDRSAILAFMNHDKKTLEGRYMFTLISKPGVPLINIECRNHEVDAAIDYYNS